MPGMGGATIGTRRTKGRGGLGVHQESLYLAVTAPAVLDVDALRQLLSNCRIQKQTHEVQPSACERGKEHDAGKKREAPTYFW